jgi:hypothetical protein
MSGASAGLVKGTGNPTSNVILACAFVRKDSSGVCKEEDGSR